MPPLFVAAMVTVWVPTGRPAADQVSTQGLAGAASMLQVTMAVGSLTVNVMVAAVEVVDVVGPGLTVTAGAPTGGGGGAVTVQV